MSHSSPPKALLLDWGGVLIDDPSSCIYAYCAEHAGVTVEQFCEVLPEAHFQEGKMTEEEFWKRICGELSVALPKEPSLYGAAFAHCYKPREEMFALAGDLKRKGFRTGLLSNTEPPAQKFFEARDYGQFDVLVFSCAEGLRKPDPRIYELALRRLGTSPEETVFVDDRPVNVDGAKDLGINAVLCGDWKTTMEQVSALFEFA